MNNRVSLSHIAIVLALILAVPRRWSPNFAHLGANPRGLSIKMLSPFKKSPSQNQTDLIMRES